MSKINMQTVDLIVGSQMGSAEYVAEQLLESLDSQGFTVNLHEQPKLDDCQEKRWLVVTSTYGAGDYPENLLPFIDDLKAQSHLNDLQYAIVGIGDSSYDTFNHAAINLKKLLIAKGATQLLDILKIDVLEPELPEDTALEWLPKFVQHLTLDSDQ
jgi:MioC protein